MTIEELVNSEEFQKYIKNNPVKPIFINALGEVKPIDTEETQKLKELSEKLKEAVKTIQLKFKFD